MFFGIEYSKARVSGRIVEIHNGNGNNKLKNNCLILMYRSINGDMLVSVSFFVSLSLFSFSDFVAPFHHHNTLNAAFIFLLSHTSRTPIQSLQFSQVSLALSVLYAVFHPCSFSHTHFSFYLASNSVRFVNSTTSYMKLRWN